MAINWFCDKNCSNTSYCSRINTRWRCNCSVFNFWTMMPPFRANNGIHVHIIIIWLEVETKKTNVSATSAYNCVAIATEQWRATVEQLVQHIDAVNLIGWPKLCTFVSILLAQVNQNRMAVGQGHFVITIRWHRVQWVDLREIGCIACVNLRFECVQNMTLYLKKIWVLLFAFEQINQLSVNVNAQCFN